MSVRTDDLSAVKNKILGALTTASRRRLLAQSQFTQLKAGEVIHPAHSAIEQMLFPVAGLVSIMVPDGHKETEIAMVGSEGVVGIPLLFGRRHSPMSAVAQAAGYAVRLRAAAVSDALKNDRVFSRVLHGYGHEFLEDVARAAMCAQLHRLENRCARWLLMAQDRLGGDTFLLTHQSLASILGVRRASVTDVAAGLQRTKVIRYARGELTILDRTKLERAACACYKRPGKK